MRFTKILYVAAAAGLFATPAFAQASQSAVAPTKSAMKAEKKEAKAEKKEMSAEHKALEAAPSASKMWLKGVKLSKSEVAPVNTITKKYKGQLATLKKDHLAAEKAGTETDAQLSPKIQAILDQEKADLRAALTTAQQAKFDANIAGKPAK